MVVRLRLQRFGRTHAPFYRIVAADSRAPRDGRFIEIIGTYNPQPDEGARRTPRSSQRIAALRADVTQPPLLLGTPNQSAASTSP